MRFCIDIAERNGSALRRVLRSAERLSERAMALGSPLRSITSCDHFFVVAMPLNIPKERMKLEPGRRRLTPEPDGHPWEIIFNQRALKSPVACGSGVDHRRAMHVSHKIMSALVPMTTTRSSNVRRQRPPMPSATKSALVA